MEVFFNSKIHIIYAKSGLDITTEKPKIERCATCRQLVEQTIPYLGHPDAAVEEFIGITDKRLSLFEDGENQIFKLVSCKHIFLLRYGRI